MKKVLFLIMFFCSNFILLADDIFIGNDPGQMGTGENDKEFVLDLRASIDDGVITLNTSLSTWGVTVIIYNGDEVPVYYSTSMDESVTHQFYVGTLPADNYTLEIQIGDSAFSGEFTIN